MRQPAECACNLSAFFLVEQNALDAWYFKKTRRLSKKPSLSLIQKGFGSCSAHAVQQPAAEPLLRNFLLFECLSMKQNKVLRKDIKQGTSTFLVFYKYIKYVLSREGYDDGH